MRAALQARLRDDRLAAHRAAAERELDPLQRLALETAAKHFGPVDDEAAIGRAQRRHRDAGLGQRRDPAAIGPEPRPACATQGQDGGIRAYREAALCSREQEAAVIVPAAPVMTQLEGDTARDETPEPGPQQRRRLHGSRKHPTARADERKSAPRASHQARNWVGRKRLDRGPQAWLGVAVAAEEPLELFAVGEIETAAAGEQELATDRRHAVVDGHGRAAAHEHLGRHQSGGAASDHGNMKA